MKKADAWLIATLWRVGAGCALALTSLWPDRPFRPPHASDDFLQPPPGAPSLQSPMARALLQQVDDAERARMSETIDEMNRMLEDILSLARAGRSAESPQKVDLAALADAVVEDFVELGSPVTLADSDRAVALVRPQQIRRALRNLIENAIVYGDRAHVSVFQEAGQVRIVVADVALCFPPTTVWTPCRAPITLLTRHLQFHKLLVREG